MHKWHVWEITLVNLLKYEFVCEYIYLNQFYFICAFAQKMYHSSNVFLLVRLWLWLIPENVWFNVLIRMSYCKSARYFPLCFELTWDFLVVSIPYTLLGYCSCSQTETLVPGTGVEIDFPRFDLTLSRNAYRSTYPQLPAIFNTS